MVQSYGKIKEQAYPCTIFYVSPFSVHLMSGHFLCFFFFPPLDLKDVFLIEEIKNEFVRLWANNAVTATAGEVRPS